jgi:hypothetical protein
MRFTSSIIRLPNYLLSLDYVIFTSIMRLLSLTLFIQTLAVNFPCGWNPEHLQKTYNFRQIKTFVDSFHAHEFEAKSNAQTKRCMKGACSDDDYAAEYF